MDEDNGGDSCIVACATFGVRSQSLIALWIKAIVNELDSTMPLVS